MQITATELKLNLDHYLELVRSEDIWITKNGKIIAKMIDPNITSVDSISGILKGRVPENYDRYTLREDLIMDAVNDAKLSKASLS